MDLCGDLNLAIYMMKKNEDVHDAILPIYRVTDPNFLLCKLDS
jgi:hypothetical protein